MTALQTARRWTTVAPGVLVTTSERYATTTTLAVLGDEVLLVDPCWAPDELTAIADDLAALGLRVTAGFATHAHHDHVLWHPRFGDVPRWASSGAAALAAAEHAANLAALPDQPPEVRALVGRLTPTDGEDLPAGTELVVHDAHSTGHAALLLTTTGVLLAGDMLSDVELPLAGETGLAAYRAGLELLRPVVERAEVLVPGHGSVAVGRDRVRARLAADTSYLDAVEAGRPVSDPRLEHSTAGPDNRDAHAALVAAVGAAAAAPPGRAGDGADL